MRTARVKETKEIAEDEINVEYIALDSDDYPEIPPTPPNTPREKEIDTYPENCFATVTTFSPSSFSSSSSSRVFKKAERIRIAIVDEDNCAFNVYCGITDLFKHVRKIPYKGIYICTARNMSVLPDHIRNLKSFHAKIQAQSKQKPKPFRGFTGDIAEDFCALADKPLLGISTQDDLGQGYREAGCGSAFKHIMCAYEKSLGSSIDSKKYSITLDSAKCYHPVKIKESDNYSKNFQLLQIIRDALHLFPDVEIEFDFFDDEPTRCWTAAHLHLPKGIYLNVHQYDSSSKQFRLIKAAEKFPPQCVNELKLKQQLTDLMNNKIIFSELVNNVISEMEKERECVFINSQKISGMLVNYLHKNLMWLNPDDIEEGLKVGRHYNSIFDCEGHYQLSIEWEEFMESLVTTQEEKLKKEKKSLVSLSS